MFFIGLNSNPISIELTSTYGHFQFQLSLLPIKLDQSNFATFLTSIINLDLKSRCDSKECTGNEKTKV